MTIVNTSVVALKALRRNPTRALLTTLGIVIGIAAVITMMEIGRGSSKSIQTSIEKMGANSVLIRPGWRSSGGIRLGAGSSNNLTSGDAEAIARECPSIAFCSPVVQGSGIQAIVGGKNWQPSISGVAPSFLKIRNFSIEDGRCFTDREVERNARVCIVGQTVVRELFGGNSPIDSEIRIKNTSLRVIGVLKSKGANMMGWDEDDTIMLPWTTMRMRIMGQSSGTATHTTSTVSETPGETYPVTGMALYPESNTHVTKDAMHTPRLAYINQIVFSCTSPEKVEQALAEVNRVLRERHRLKQGDEEDFRVHNSADFMSMLSTTSTVMTNLLLGVALISLLVGGVGIMNIMLVSVTERTREIGLRMAVGARSRDILKQFLIESIVLCLAGGLLGILLGHGAALLINAQFDWPIESSPDVVVMAVAVSAAVGIIFGFYPAWKASKLDPIDALRYE